MSSYARVALTFAEQLAQAVMDSMSPALVGLYLHGSPALGDIVSGRSDVDLCVVVSELADNQSRRLYVACQVSFPVPASVPNRANGYTVPSGTAILSQGFVG